MITERENGSHIVLGVPIAITSYLALLNQITHAINHGRSLWITTPNPEIVLRAHKDPMYKAILTKSDIAIADGIGIVVADAFLQSSTASRWEYLQLLMKTFFLGHPGSTNMTQVSGDQLVYKLLPIAHKHCWKIALIGGLGNTAQRASDAIREQFPGCKIYSHPGHRKYLHRTLSEDNEILSFIQQVNPHIILVGYGAPYQEYFIHDYLKNISAVKIGIGGTLDELAGNVKSTPDFLRKRGLRWLWRLTKQPSRITRIWNATVLFSWEILKEKHRYQSGVRN